MYFQLLYKIIKNNSGAHEYSDNDDNCDGNIKIYNVGKIPVFDKC